MLHPVWDGWQRRVLVVATRCEVEEAWYRAASVTGARLGPTGVWSTARVDSAAVKVGKVSWVASACLHSEGAAYKPQGGEIAACPRDWRMGS